MKRLRLNSDDLVTFLRTLLDPFVVEGLIDEYRIGVTKSRATIFFQIDQEGRCRTGKLVVRGTVLGIGESVTWIKEK